MSSICGHIDLDPASPAEVVFGEGAVQHPDAGCTIVADATLYYRDELIDRLGKETRDSSDSKLILAAYLRWGEDCLNYLEGDFAFAIRDSRSHRLFCARDRYGMRPFYYHHAPARLFAFASAARAVLEYAGVPFAANEGRIADFIVGELEWIDYTSTFFEDINRLPPAHKLTITSSGLQVTEYYKPEPGPELLPRTDAEYCEAFLELFSRAVDERLRVAEGEAGLALSGGIDSGSIAAIARGRVHPYSLARRRGMECEESRRIHATLDHLGLEGTQIIADEDRCLPDSPFENIAEPFDGEYLFLRALYGAARQDGSRIVLDGAAGDVVFNESGYIARLMRQGRLIRAWHEVAGQQAFYGATATVPAFSRYLGSALTPDVLKLVLRPARQRRHELGFIEESLLCPEFAKRIDINARFDRMRDTFSGWQSSDPAVERVRKIRPNLTAGRERFARIVASAGVEARDPYTDQRVVDYCSRLPDCQLARNGWPKYLLRTAMEGKLPDEVRWGRGKPHIGYLFNATFVRQEILRGSLCIESLAATLEGYVDAAKLRRAWHDCEAGHDSGPIHTAYVLSQWLEQSVTRPVVKNQGFS